ncbi:MAG: 30S ribosomal protein S17e [Candidatus Methanomethylicaceae archaeon]
MGKVRIGKVKSIAVELTERYPNVFTTDFENNKKLVRQYSNIRSKHLSNRVAGYITRLLVLKKKREEALAAEEAELTKMAGGVASTEGSPAQSQEGDAPTEGTTEQPSS